MSEETVLILACATILDELQLAIDQADSPFPVVLVESGLHLYPDKLKSRLQEELDRIVNVDRVLLAFGYCGNCVVGIKPPSFTLTLPRAADCISLLLGSSQRRAEIQGEAQTYFLTRGWLEHERNIYREYELEDLKATVCDLEQYSLAVLTSGSPLPMCFSAPANPTWASFMGAGGRETRFNNPPLQPNLSYLARPCRAVSGHALKETCAPPRKESPTSPRHALSRLVTVSPVRFPCTNPSETTGK